MYGVRSKVLFRPAIYDNHSRKTQRANHTWLYRRHLRRTVKAADTSMRWTTKLSVTAESSRETFAGTARRMLSRVTLQVTPAPRQLRPLLRYDAILTTRCLPSREALRSSLVRMHAWAELQQMPELPRGSRRCTSWLHRELEISTISADGIGIL